MTRPCLWCEEPLPANAHHSAKYHAYCRADSYRDKARQQVAEWNARNRQHRRDYNREWMRKARSA